ADGRWTIEVQVGNDTSRIDMLIESEQDGSTIFGSMEYRDGSPYGDYVNGDFIRPTWIEAWPDARTVPRGFFGRSPTDRFHDTSGATTYPERRVYLSGPVDVTNWSSLVIDWSDGTSAEYHISSSDAATNSLVLLRPIDSGYSNPPERYAAGSLPRIAPTRSLGSGTLADLRDALVADGPVYCNRGTAPFLTGSDLADWTDVVNQRIGPLTANRRWSASKPVDVTDLLTAEFQLLGVYPIIDGDGKIAIRAIEIPNASISDAVAIDDEIISVGWADMERGGQTINRVVVKTGYSARDDKWIGPPYEVLDVDAYADDHVDRAITVEPRGIHGLGATAETEQFSAEDITAAFMPLLGLFGAPYDIVTVNVSWKLFSVLLGDFVSLSAIHLPNANNGVRPISAVNGVVIGRKWELGEAHGTLTILLTWQNVSGYAPTARISTQTNTSGNTWNLELNGTMYTPDASSPVDTFFAADDVIRIVQYDAESPTVVTGTVVSVSGGANHLVTVDLDSAWSPGGSTWELCYGSYTSVTSSQKRFCFMADSTALLDGDNARTYAP
ncbi:MAG TPA: hypothetical protein VFS15_28950, partial [Kofleriaceae bacterium]|nr:hypothetical protein [Kofleriaceae bacterium]